MPLQQKIDWLKRIGFEVVTTDTGEGWNATHYSLSAITLTRTSMTIVINGSPCSIQGWATLPLDVFKAVTISLLQVPTPYTKQFQQEY